MVYAARLECVNGHTICGVIRNLDPKNQEPNPWMSYLAGLFFADLVKRRDVELDAPCPCGATGFTISIKPLDDPAP